MISPPSGVNLIALVSRLTTLAAILSASISKVPRSSASSTFRWRWRAWTNGDDLVGDAAEQRGQVDRGALERLAEVVGPHQGERVGDELGELPGARRRSARRAPAPARCGSGSSSRSSSLRPRTSVIGVLNSWLATSMNALLSWPASSSSWLARVSWSVGRLELGDQPLPLGQQLVLLGRLADDPLELDRRPTA